MLRFLDTVILRYEAAQPGSLEAAGWRLVKRALEWIYVPRTY